MYYLLAQGSVQPSTQMPGWKAQIRDLTGSGEVTKRRIKEGVGEFPVDCPLEDCAVRVHYTARLAGTDQVSAQRHYRQCTTRELCMGLEFALLAHACPVLGQGAS